MIATYLQEERSPPRSTAAAATAAITNGDASTVEHIDAVDAFARNLYLRLKQCSSAGADPPLDDVAIAVRQLHLALRHLRVEAADPDSLLNRAASTSLYVRQLEPLVEDCGFQLRQLETALSTIDIQGGAARADRLATLRAKLANEKMSVDMFLDTIQLHNPANQPAGIVDGSQLGLENIKDKVDAIAHRLFARRDVNGLADDEDRLWEEFKQGLEKEGFSPQVLRRHKDVLRAYIRELETMSQHTGGVPPTVRGLLEHEAKTLPSANNNSSSPKEMYPAIENEKFPTGMKDLRRMPDAAPMAPASRGMMYHDREPRRSVSSEDSAGSDGSESMALISTRDLMAMDHLNASVANMHLNVPNQYYSTSPSANQRYLPSSAPGSLPNPVVAELAGSPGSAALSASPRSMATLPPYTSPQLPPYSSSPRTSTGRLAPDSYGNEIPMDAQWTRIRRSLISLEVLDRSGLRYEARPEYVAVLGRLTREQIASYAKLSAECRAARSSRYSSSSHHHHPPPSSSRRYEKARDRADSKSSREDEDDDSVLWDESDTTDFDDDKTSDKGSGSKHKIHIVNFPDREKETTSPSSTVQPKSILKNKNENHVRFDPEPREMQSSKSYSPPPPSRDDRRSSSRRYHNDDRLYGADNHRRYNSNSNGAENPRHRRTPDDRDRYYARRGGPGRDRRDRDRDRDRDRERERERYRDPREDEQSRREEKSSKKKAWGETLGAVGIGGAAVSLLGVLAEAATGM